MSEAFRWWFKHGCFFGVSLIVIGFGMALVVWANAQQDPFRIIVGLILGAVIIIAGMGLLFAFLAPIGSRILYVLRGGS